jgi:site-specific recombinase XerD
MPDQYYPPLLKSFINYQRNIRGKSERTLEQYTIDLQLFMRYIYALRNDIDLNTTPISSVVITGINETLLYNVTTEDIYEFFNYTVKERSNSSRTRARKLSSIKSFYKYLCVTEKLIDFSPAENIESPTQKKTLPRFLTLDESLTLLDAINSDETSQTKARDYAIVTFFLNTGIRLSELASINLTDIDGEMKSMRIVGKGDKERIIYLNDACKAVLADYLATRALDKQIEDKSRNALFISSQHKRISIKTIQFIVKKYLEAAGFGNRNFSTHKLRHTAATLMYQTGKVDVRILKDILGHEQLNTTQIYTHVSNKSMETAMSMNPLAAIENKKNDKKDTLISKDTEEPDE